MVKPFIMDITASSTTKTVSHVDVSIGGGEPDSVSLGILEFQRLFKVLKSWFLLNVCPIMSKKKKRFEIFSKFIVLKAFLKDWTACRAD